MKKIIMLFFLLFISQSLASTTINADFRTTAARDHYTTDMYFDPAFSCSLTSGKILEGTPCSTGSATVCPGAQISVTPRINARWARTSLDIVSSYPYCRGGDYCPVMEDYYTIAPGDIKWLSSSLYSAYDPKTGGHAAYDYQFGSAAIFYYHELGTFYSEAVSYYDVTDGPIYPHKKGYANIFCKGNLEVRKGTTIAGSSEAAEPTAVSVSFPSEGTYPISTWLTNTECFAAVVKHPLDEDRPLLFNLYFYGYNTPSVPSVSSNSVNIIVENRQPSLSNVPPRTVTQSPSAPSTYLISITAYNNGSVPVRIVSVHPIGDGRVSPAGEYYCNIYGFPPAICPSDNGFGKTINVGDRQRVYVIYTGELNGNIFNLEYEPLQPVCSDATKFNLTVNINLGNNTPTSCTIAPRHLSLTPSEIHEWVVTCYNSADRVVPCVGDNWYFEDAYGGFIEKTNTRAKGYVRSVAGLFPTLVYQTDSVRCESELSINPNEPESPNDPYSFVCQLTPESAELSVGENQRFVLNCSLEGTPVSPTDARYDLVNGLEGTLGDASITGVTFTATTNSSGDVQVIAWYTAPGDPTLRGAIDWAHVVVGAGRNETGNETEERRGDVCELIPGYMEKYQHDAGYVGILCGEGEEKGPCSSTTTINWNVAPDLYGRVITPTTNGARFTIGSEGGTPTAGPHTGGITAVIVGSDGNPLGQCWADISILESTCLDYS